MRQVLFRIPLDGVLQLGSLTIPWFGLGILLAVWFAVGCWGFLARRRACAGKWQPDDLHAAILWAVIAGVIVAAPLIAKRFGQTGVPVFGYGAMLFLGFVTAVTLASHRAEKQGLSPDVIWDLAPWLLIPGILGARIFFCVQKREEMFKDYQLVTDYVWTFVNLSHGGLVLYGGLVGGAMGFFAFCHESAGGRWRFSWAKEGVMGFLKYCLRSRFNPLGLADLITPSIFIGIGFGRIGCLLNGCCYGDVCHLPWAIRFPQGSVTFLAFVSQGFIPPDAVTTPWLHPTQIYSAIDGFLIAALTWTYYPHRHRNGEVFSVGLMIYATTRFLIEFLRGDEPGQLGTGLTISQLISLGMFVTGLLVILDRARRPAFRQLAMATPPAGAPG